MESSDHDDDDDFINDKPKYPQKNIFTASFSIDKAEIVDHTMKPRETDSAEGACSICGKNISHLNETRRLQHVNRCLDSGEQRKNFNIKTSSYESTIDCPLCKVQLPPGPFRITHLKKCSTEYHISVAQVLQLVKTQEQIAAIRRANNLPHTTAIQPTFESCAVKKRKNKLMPKSVDDEQLQLALTLSMSESSLFADSCPAIVPNGTISTGRHKHQFAATIPTVLQTITPEEQLKKLQDRLFAVINNVVSGEESKTTVSELGDKVGLQVGWWNMHRLTESFNYENALSFDKVENDFASAESISASEIPSTSKNVVDSPCQAKTFEASEEIESVPTIKSHDELFVHSSSEADLLSSSPPDPNDGRSDAVSDKNNDFLDRSNGSDDMFECVRSSTTPNLFVDGEMNITNDIYLIEHDRTVTCSEATLYHCVEEYSMLSPIIDSSKNRIGQNKESEKVICDKTLDDSADLADVPLAQRTKNQANTSNVICDKTLDDSVDLADVPLAQRIKRRANIISVSSVVVSNPLQNHSVVDLPSVDAECESNNFNSGFTNIHSFNIIGDEVDPKSFSSKSDDDLCSGSFLLENLPEIETETQSKKMPTKLKKLSKTATDNNVVDGTPKFLENNTYTILKRTNVTPMPEFNDLNTPELKHHLSKYGVRPMARRRAVPLLRKLYNETHPCINDDGRLFVEESDGSAKAKRKRKPKLPTANKRLSCSQPIASTTKIESDLTKEKKKLKNVQDKPSLSQEMKEESSSGEESDCDPVAEETFMPTDNEPVVEPKDINEQLRNFFMGDIELYRKILKYEPLPLKEMHAKVKSASIKCSLKTFMDFMDAQCITFTMKDERKPGTRFRTPKKGRLK